MHPGRRSRQGIASSNCAATCSSVPSSPNRPASCTPIGRPPLDAPSGRAIAGWRGGLWGHVLMRLVDVQLALPAILFAALLAALVGPSLRNVIIILLIWTWPSYGRLVRGTCSRSRSATS